MGHNFQGEPFTKALALELKVSLVLLGCSQLELASRTGVAAPSVNHWINGERPVPFSFAYGSCRAMGISIVDLLSVADARLRAPTGQVRSFSLPIVGEAEISPSLLKDESNLFVDRLSVELLRAARDGGLTVSEIARHTGYSPSSVSRWLNGKKVAPVSFVHDACTVISLPIEELASRALPKSL